MAFLEKQAFENLALRFVSHLIIFAEKTAYFPSQTVIFLWHTLTMKANFLHKNKNPEIVYFHIILFLCCDVCAHSITSVVSDSLRPNGL